MSGISPLSGAGQTPQLTPLQGRDPTLAQAAGTSSTFQKLRQESEQLQQKLKTVDGKLSDVAANVLSNRLANVTNALNGLHL